MFQDQSQLPTAPLGEKAQADPGNTAGPVLPHRPSETQPVLRNHREGLVTCSTVATCPKKTSPVGLLVTQRKHQRSWLSIRGCSRPPCASGITPAGAGCPGRAGSPLASAT